MSKPQHQRIPIDASRWSPESRRSISVESAAEYYEDIRYDCIACGAPSIFTAEAQKGAYETRKAHIWQRRLLCEPCFDMRQASERELRAIRSRWRASRADLKRDAAALKRWQDLLLLLPMYGARRDVAAIAMVRKVLSDLGASLGATRQTPTGHCADKDL